MENKLISINRLLEYVLTGKVEYLKETKIAKNLVEELLGEEHVMDKERDKIIEDRGVDVKSFESGVAVGLGRAIEIILGVELSG